VSETYKQSEGSWDLIIEPPDKLLDFRFHELYHYRDLLILLIRRDFVAAYKQTVVGPMWFVIQPIMTTLVYILVFGNIAKLGTDGMPQTLFYFSGTILWTYFAHCLTKCANTFNTNAQLFRKIYFPRMAVPISYVAMELLSVSIQFVMLVGFYVYFLVSGVELRPNLWLLAIPLFLLQLGALGVGFGVIISSMTTKYRDLKQLLSFGMQLWMYCSAIVYPLSKVPEKWMWAFTLNPVVPIVAMFRYALFGDGTCPVQAWLISLGLSIVALLLGIVIFNRNERTFIDVI
jgi:lipopolysaccharide transport system permease protein